MMFRGDMSSAVEVSIVLLVVQYARLRGFEPKSFDGIKRGNGPEPHGKSKIHTTYRGIP